MLATRRTRRWLLLLGIGLVLIYAIVRLAPRSHTSNSTQPSPAHDAINSIARVLYSMDGPHEGAPHGVPSYFSWAQHPDLGAVVPPAGMTAMTGWGQIYADSTDAHPANVRVELRNMETYVWSISTRRWIRLQSNAHVDGAHYVEDFAGNMSISTSLRNEADGGTSTDMVSGYNFHFWPGERASLSDPADVGAVFTTVQARLVLDDPNGPDNRNQARYLANTGADWWRTTSSDFGDGSNNPGVGQSRFTYVTNDWSAINFYTGGPIIQKPGSWTDAQLQHDPPPLNAM